MSFIPKKRLFIPLLLLSHLIFLWFSLIDSMAACIYRNTYEQQFNLVPRLPGSNASQNGNYFKDILRTMVGKLNFRNLNLMEFDYEMSLQKILPNPPEL